MRVVRGLWAAGRRGLTWVAAVLTGWLLVAGCAAGSVPGAAGKAGTAGAASAQLWAERYNGFGNGFDRAASVVVSPDGRRVYVTGRSAGRSLKGDYATIAYDAVTGARLWVSRYNGSANGYDFATTVALSPDGKTVFVTGTIYGGPASPRDDATIAYDAVTGARLWVSIYPGQDPYGYGFGPMGMVVSPDGRTVYVMGHEMSGVGSDGVKTYGFAIIAYDAATGARLWDSIFAPPGGSAIPEGIGISPDGTNVFVTGMNDSAGRDTVAFDAATGARLWASSGYAGFGLTTSLAVRPGGGTVFVSGSRGGRLRLDTIAYDAATGTRRWESAGPPGGAWSLAVSPDGTKVFATGYAREAVSTYLTVAYDAATGTRLWVSATPGARPTTRTGSAVRRRADGRRAGRGCPRAGRPAAAIPAPAALNR